MEDNTIQDVKEAAKGVARSLVEVLIANLDDKFDKWDLYRAAMGHWVLRADEETFSDSNLVRVLETGNEFKVLPKIPRRPLITHESGFVPYKSGGKWRMRYNGQDTGGIWLTKKSALDIAAMWSSRSFEDARKWDNEYHKLVSEGQENVTFRFIN